MAGGLPATGCMCTKAGLLAAWRCWGHCCRVAAVHTSAAAGPSRAFSIQYTQGQGRAHAWQEASARPAQLAQLAQLAMQHACLGPVAGAVAKARMTTAKSQWAPILDCRR
jgi:hypothetical protein